jgi:lipid-A-disaccharide synthase
LPNERLVAQARGFALPGNVRVQAGDLARALSESSVAIASTGTVTLECALFGLPTIAMYKASWVNYQIAKRIVKVKYLAMPNLLANEEILPEFIQHRATAENIARATLEFLQDETKRNDVKSKLARIIQLLGPPGASQRAARSIWRLLEPETKSFIEAS